MSLSLVCAILASTVSIVSMIRQLGGIQIAGGVLFGCQGTGHLEALHPFTHSMCLLVGQCYEEPACVGVRVLMYIITVLCYYSGSEINEITNS